MKQFSYPTTILFGEGALEKGVEIISKKYKRPLIVTDQTLQELGYASELVALFKKHKVQAQVFQDIQTNPTEEDIDKGAKVFLDTASDCLVGFGGGSPMDAAKVIAVRATQKGPMAQFDDALGGDALIDGELLPPNFAIPTTAGTGSEVGRAGVITVAETQRKTIIYHPKLLPTLAILEPRLTLKLPPHITAATGLDAFTHLLEAYFAPGFHPMADGIALEGMRLVLKNLGECVKNGSNITARGEMMMAASMGATAFQKGLGMIHAIAHPLSSECGLHHGLANALILPTCVEFLEQSDLNDDQKARIEKVKSLLMEHNLACKPASLSESCQAYFESLGIEFGLKSHGVKESQFDVLAEKAFLDVSHKTSMIAVTKKDLRAAIEGAF